MLHNTVKLNPLLLDLSFVDKLEVSIGETPVTVNSGEGIFKTFYTVIHSTISYGERVLSFRNS